VALVLAVLVPPVGLVLGLISHRRGDRRARAAIVIGVVLTVVAVAVGYLLVRGPRVSAQDVAVQIAQQSGLAPGQVTCPGPLPAQVGASVVCIASAGAGRTQSLRATVTEVDGWRVEFALTAQ
jgi:hypothetical protein